MDLNSELLYELTFGLFYKIMQLSAVLLEFLFTEIITLPLGDTGEITITMWQVLGGAGIVLMIIAWLAKKIVPLL